MRLLIENADVYEGPVMMCFLDYQKAFGTVETVLNEMGAPKQHRISDKEVTRQ